MSPQLVKSGVNCPDDINVIIEIPAHSDPVKYEVDKETGAIHVDRFMATAMRYPCNYGYIPNTLAEDGDPTDVLVITPFPVISGSVVRCRPISMLNMTDEAGKDIKILSVPVSKLCPMYERIKSYKDLQPLLTAQIQHFFEHYKDLEKDKWVKIEGWKNEEQAKIEITKSIIRYQEHEAH